MQPKRAVLAILDLLVLINPGFNVSYNLIFIVFVWYPSQFAVFSCVLENQVVVPILNLSIVSIAKSLVAIYMQVDTKKGKITVY